ncbi:MAG: DUF2142 domain-containing protein [Candidatus Saccharibacteria bacterium]|nr:DUF2142 domain-containing protein [Candidatus Saccharibacteria bacterium]
MKRIFFVIWFLITVASFFVIGNYCQNYYSDSFYSEKVDFEDSIAYNLRENSFEQDIVVDNDNFSGVNLYFTRPGDAFIDADYVEGYVKFELFDEKNNLVDGYNIEYLFYDSGRDRIRIKVPTISDSKGKIYHLKLSSYRDFGSLFFTLAKKTNDSYGETIINDEASEYGIVYESLYDGVALKTLMMVIAGVISIIIFVALLFIFKVTKLENIYLLIAMTCGIVLIFVANPYYGFDEADHLAHIYGISNGQILPERSEEGWPIVRVPGEFTDVLVNNYQRISQHIGSEADYENYFENNMEYTGVYSPLSYVFQVPLMWMARLATNRALVWSYIVRFGQLLIGVFLTREIIKRAKVGQKIFFAVALLPAYMCAMSFVSADCIFSIASLALFSTILNIINGHAKFNKKHAVLLFICALFAAVGKLMFFPLIFTLFLIPMTTKKKQDYKRVIMMILPILAIVLIWNLIAAPYMVSAQGINSGHQISYYLTNPIELIQLLAYSFFNSFGNHMSDLFGGRNAWYGPTINDGSLLPIIFAAIFALIVMNEKFEITKRQRYLILAIVGIEIACIMGSMLLVCMPPYHNEIVGIQGRYFTMLLPLIALLVVRKKNNLQYDFWRYVPATLLLCYLIYLLRFIVRMCSF